MANNAYQELLPANSDITKTSLLSTLIARTVYVLQSAEDTQTIDLQTSLMVAKDEDFFLYDPTDTTTAHDGTSVLVDSGGRRYKITDELQFPSSVLDRLATPPGSPTVGDEYLVTSGATGAWAGKEDNVAVWTNLGWKFVLPRVGVTLYVEDETAFYHHNAAGAWVAGLGSLSLAADAVTVIEDQNWGLVSVEATLNTPPGSPSNGQMWLVGTSPTGDFVGHNDKIALRRAGAWEFESPYEGARIWDKTLNAYLTYAPTSWNQDATFTAVEFIGSYSFGTSGHTTTVDFTGLSGYREITILFVNLSGTGTNGWALRTSDDDGATFESGATDYVTDGSTQAQIPVIGAAAGPWRGRVDLHNFNTSSFPTVATCHVESTPVTNMGNRAVGEANDAFRLFMHGGTPNNTNSGTIVVTGRRG